MSLARSLLRWYDVNRRELPWRGTLDPYRIWVSEIMLQQTRVETVLPYYDGFLERFPTVAELAAADEEEVLASWAGLGYYRRARFLHRAARQVAREGGALPVSAEEWRRLPGVGEYTAAAIASIAHGELIPVLDGNVERVLARRSALRGDPKRASSRRALLEAARGLLTPERPGDGNQAMMELGATVCTPRAPGCPECPLSAGCRAFEEGRPEAYPRPRRRAPTQKTRRVIAVVSRGDRFLLFRRHSSERQLADTWELPWVDAGADDPSLGLAERYGGGGWSLEADLGRARHSITNQSITAEVHRARLDEGAGGLAEGPPAAWLTAGEIAEKPTSSLVGKALAIWFRNDPAAGRRRA